MRLNSVPLAPAALRQQNDMDTTNMTARSPECGTYRGIDYGMGQLNIDKATGIRFGVISQHSLMPEALDDCWQNSRDLTYEAAVAEFKRKLERCENDDELNELIAEELGERVAKRVGFQRRETGLEEVWESICDYWNDAYQADDHDWLYEQDGYKLTNCLQSDVFILSSPYFTYAQYCSPCVPGACNLDSPLVTPPDSGDFEPDWQALRDNRAYCLGHDWFEGGKAPYPVYSVATGELVAPAA